MRRPIKLLLLFLLSLTYQALAQTPWIYDFGTGTGSFITANTSSETFLPNPQSGAGTDRVYVGNTGGGFALVNSGGSDSELQITASTGDTSGNINKFSVYDYTPGTSFSIGFTIRFDCEASDNGTAYFFIGDGDYFVDSIRYTASDLFTGMKWQKSVDSSFMQTYKRTTAGWSLLGDYNFSLGTEYYVELFGNNTGSTVFYNYDGSPQAVFSYSWALWIDGSFVGDAFRPGGGISDNDPIDSYMFLTENSTSNQLVMVVDDIAYSNSLINGPLPVELSSFTAKYIGNNVNLNWRTETEVNNYGFEVLRQAQDDKQWTKIGFVNGSGNSNSPKDYSFTDYNLVNGNKYQYRLKQIDNDGQFAYSKTVEVSFMKPNEFKLEQNYPNPFNPVTTIQYSISTASYVKLTVFNILGEEISTLVNEYEEAGNYSINFNASLLNSGIYFCKLEGAGYNQVRKMSLLK